MNKISYKNLKELTVIFSTFIMLVGCNSISNSDNNTSIENKKVNIPSFSDKNKEKVGCGKVGSDESECSKEKPLSSEDMILESLMKSHPIAPSVEKEKKSKNISQALTSLVEDAEPKEEKSSNSKQSLELLVASATNLNNEDEKSIGKFDVEKFSSTWKELQSLVDNSEETQIKKKSLREDLETLVVSASTDTTSQEKIKDLLTIATNTPSVEQLKFTSSVVSDMSDKSIDLLEANDQWIKIKIRAGDTLSNYAEKYYGDAKKYKIIYEANRDVIGKNYTIHIGSTLIIPTLNSIQGI